MTDTINISRNQTNKTFKLTTLYNETKHNENEMYIDSPLSLNTNFTLLNCLNMSNLKMYPNQCSASIAVAWKPTGILYTNDLLISY